MAMFNSYVKLPEGINYEWLSCTWAKDVGNNGCLQRKDLISGLERLGVGGHSFMEDGKQTSERPLNFMWNHVEPGNATMMMCTEDVHFWKGWIFMFRNDWWFWRLERWLWCLWAILELCRYANPSGSWILGTDESMKGEGCLGGLCKKKSTSNWLQMVLWMFCINGFNMLQLFRLFSHLPIRNGDFP